MSTAPTLTWEEYQKLPPGKRSRPLTPQEYAAFTKSQTQGGAPADFGGMVLPNPNHIKVSDDTESGVEPLRLPQGVTLQQQNFTGPMPADASNPLAAQIIPGMLQDAAANMSATPITITPDASSSAGSPVTITPDAANAPASAKTYQSGHDSRGSYATPGDAINQVADMLGESVKSLAKVSSPNMVYEMIRSHFPQLGLKPALGMPTANEVGATGVSMMIPGAEGEGAAEVPKEVPKTETASVVAPKGASSAASLLDHPGVSPWVDAMKSELMKIPGMNLAKTALKSAQGFAEGAEHPAPPTPAVPTTNGVPWGSKIPPTGPPELWGKEIPQTPTAQATPTAAPAATPAKVEQALNDALGGKPLVRGVPLRNQPAAQAAAAGKLPAGFTPVDSSVLKGYKYDPAAQEFTAITNNGQSYTHGEVTPEQVAAFENADSQGSAWTKFIRNNNVLVKKNGVPVTPGTMGSESGNIMPKSRSGMNEPETETYSQPLQQMLDEALQDKNTAPTGKSGSILNRLVKGEAGQAGSPGSVTDADEGIADIQSRPVLATKTGQVPARGYLNMVGADENSVLKTPADLDSVFYHRQQIAQNGTPNVELHVDEAGNIIGAQGRHRAIAAIQQGGPSSKVNVTIYKHPFQASE